MKISFMKMSFMKFYRWTTSFVFSINVMQVYIWCHLFIVTINVYRCWFHFACILCILYYIINWNWKTYLSEIGKFSDTYSEHSLIIRVYWERAWTIAFTRWCLDTLSHYLFVHSSWKLTEKKMTFSRFYI